MNFEIMNEVLGGAFRRVTGAATSHAKIGASS
jgi:hypothetical protein